MATVEEIRNAHLALDENFPDARCECGNPTCGECSRRTLLAQLDLINLAMGGVIDLAEEALAYRRSSDDQEDKVMLPEFMKAVSDARNLLI